MTTKYGKCKLCGEMKALSFEHVPPEKAFNSQAVKGFPFEESINLMTGADGRKPWDFNGLKGKINQRGGGEYFLCEECNNNTGSWYMSEYVKMVHTFHEIVMHLSGVGMVAVSEISSYPVGFSLYIDKPETYTPPGLLINEFAKRQYDEKANIIFQGIPYLEINSLFPDDFRSKEQIEKTLMDKN